MQDEQTSLMRYRLNAVGEWVATLVVWCCAIGMSLAIVCVLFSLEE